MTKKKILIIIVAIVALSVVISLVISPSSKAPTIKAPEPGSTFTKPTTSQIKISAPKGDIVVPNFYDKVVNENNGSAILEETKDFQISFAIAENRFYIEIYNPNLKDTIPKAEVAFLSRLELTRDRACNLDVKVRTNPIFIPGPPESKNLSFCNEP